MKMMKMIQKNRKQYDADLMLGYDEALEAGMHVYWTGKQCSKGHLAHRYVSNRKCVMCNIDNGRKHKLKSINDEARKAGINQDIRRKIEEIEMMKEYSIDL